MQNLLSAHQSEPREVRRRRDIADDRRLAKPALLQTIE